MKRIDQLKQQVLMLLKQLAKDGDIEMVNSQWRLVDADEA